MSEYNIQKPDVNTAHSLVRIYAHGLKTLS